VSDARQVNCQRGAPAARADDCDFPNENLR
jgi:hypothetical protein